MPGGTQPLESGVISGGGQVCDVEGVGMVGWWGRWDGRVRAYEGALCVNVCVCIHVCDYT